jgi:parallel beta-helix repeat protein
MTPRHALLALLALAPAAAAQHVHKVPSEHPTIQEAVDVAADGDIVEISSGTYLEAVVVAGKTGLVIRAKGKVVIDPPSETGLTLDGCTDCVVEKVRVVGCPGHGILVTGSTGCLLEKCRVEDVAGDGIRVDDSSDVTLEKCTVKRAGGDGIALAVGQALPADGCTLLKNKVFDADFDAFGINGSNNVAEKNLAHKPGASGFYLDETVGGDANLCTGNKVIRPGELGFGVNGTGAEILGNKVVKSGNRGVHVLSGSGHSIRDNSLAKTGNDGVRVESGVAGVTIAANTIRKAGDDGVEVDGPTATVEDNTISAADEDGFEVDGDDGLYQRNKANGCGESGFHLSEGANNTLTLNKAHGNKLFDLEDETGGANTIAGDNAFGSTNLP